MSAESYVQKNFMTRVAQSVAHESLGNAEEANSLGRQIAEWSLANWEKVVRKYGDTSADEFEIMERVAKDMVAHRARAMETAMRSLPHR